jgi:hypothetical protein
VVELIDGMEVFGCLSVKGFLKRIDRVELWPFYGTPGQLYQHPLQVELVQDRLSSDMDSLKLNQLPADAIKDEGKSCMSNSISG